MNREAAELWSRAQEALAAATSLLDGSPDSSASRSYYAAFYALSARYAFSGRQFSKHSAVQSALNQDYIRTGKWPVHISKKFKFLLETRAVADYGVVHHVQKDEALTAVEYARTIIEQASKENPEFVLLV